MDWVVLLLLILPSFGCCCITISGFSLFGLVLVQVSARKFPLEASNLSCQPLMMSLFWKLSVCVLETLVCHFLSTKEEVLVFGVCALTTWYFWIVKFEGMNNGHKLIHGSHSWGREAWVVVVVLSCFWNLSVPFLLFSVNEKRKLMDSLFLASGTAMYVKPPRQHEFSLNLFFSHTQTECKNPMYTKL